MKIYTSNYWRYRGNRGVRISVGVPDGFTGLRALPALYPDWYTVKKWNDVKKLPDDSEEKQSVWKEYVDVYWRKLNRLGFEYVASILQDGDVLLCWCGKANYCHRSILAEWIRRYGVDVEEI